jgi:RNA polymerase sigma-70 factor (ECF subfamily)
MTPHQDYGSEDRTGWFAEAYDQLRGQAIAMLDAERVGHTLQPTALVNEAYLKLVGRDDLHDLSPDSQLAAATVAMRRILIDYARTRGRTKRGGGAKHLMIDDALDAIEERGFDVIALGPALEKLRVLDPELSRLVDLRFFVGLTVDQAAKMLAVSPRTLARDWTVAKRWLHAELSEATDADS